jgi:hypothetical protein
MGGMSAGLIMDIFYSMYLAYRNRNLHVILSEGRKAGIEGS